MRPAGAGFFTRRDEPHSFRVTRGDDARVKKGDDRGVEVSGPFVTILFTDLVGATSLLDRKGDEAADAVRR